MFAKPSFILWVRPPGRTFMRTLVYSGLLLCAVLSGHISAQSSTYLVGSDGACDYGTIQEAINGAASHAGPDSIHIANNLTYTQQALTIGGQDLIIIGGFASCSSATPAGITTINGAGGAAAPVFRISGAGVRDFSNLTIRGGDSTGTNYGGGIQFSGSGDVILRNVSVSNNTSAFGGGIYFNGSGGLAILTIETNTVILNNTAQNSGGGILINGNARLFMLKDRTTIQGNTAVNGDGGGIFVGSPAIADIGSPGYINIAAISGNSAVRGGGIAARAGSGTYEDADIRIFGTDALRPTRLSNNRASQSGGAIWLKPMNTVTCAGPCASASACLNSVYLDGNRAPEGAAIHNDSDDSILAFEVGSFTTINFGCSSTFPEPIGTLGYVPCTPGVGGCNVVENNVAETSAGVQTSGAIFTLNQDGAMQFTNLTIGNNRGGNLLRTVNASDGNVALRKSLIAANSLSSDIFRITLSDGHNDPAFELTDSTVANNVVGGATHLLRFDNSPQVVIRNNIIWQPGKLTMLYPGGPPSTLSSSDIRYNVVSDASTLTPDLQSDPKFNDPSVNDYGLRISSPALDFSPAVAGDDRGLDGRPRDQQVRPGGPRFLVRDPGALERQPPDPYLINGKFDGSLRQWTNNFPDYTRWSNQDDGPGGGSGSTEMLVPGDQTGTPGGIQLVSINGVTQCFSVPWPGIYKLRARGFTKATNFVPFPDTAAVNWKLRFNSPNCTGPVNAEGDLFLPRNLGWNSEIAPFIIPIAQSDWNFQTTLELNLTANQNLDDLSLQNPIFVRLDNVVLEYQEGGPLFANGFE
jgi:hypothetical protein